MDTHPGGATEVPQIRKSWIKSTRATVAMWLTRRCLSLPDFHTPPEETIYAADIKKRPESRQAATGSRKHARPRGSSTSHGSTRTRSMETCLPECRLNTMDQIRWIQPCVLHRRIQWGTRPELWASSHGPSQNILHHEH